MPIVMMLNLKGGVAKTANTVAIAECLASEGYRTLVIDADHQCTSSALLLGEERYLRAEVRRKTLHDMLAQMLDGEFDVEVTSRFIEPRASTIGAGLEGLDVLPCSIRISDFQTNMARARRGFSTNDEFLVSWARHGNNLGRWLERNYDFVFVDCPPAVAVQVNFLLKICDGYIIPSIPDRLSIRGAEFLLEYINRRRLKTRSLGILWTLVRKQVQAHMRHIAELAGGTNGALPRPFTTHIPNAATIAEAAEAVTGFESFKAKYGACAAKYAQLCGEIRERLQQ